MFQMTADDQLCRMHAVDLFFMAEQQCVEIPADAQHLHQELTTTSMAGTRATMILTNKALPPMMTLATAVLASPEFHMHLQAVQHPYNYGLAVGWRQHLRVQRTTSRMQIGEPLLNHLVVTQNTVTQDAVHKRGD